jgi:uncharacterized protein YcbK (DUF882 family)
MAGRIARSITLTFGSSAATGRFGLAALILLVSADSLQNAVAVGDTRTISMHHTHTGEDITVTFRQNGRYDDEALKKLNWFLRDWRTDEPTKMDPKLFDMLSEVHRETGAEKPIHIISAYRSPKTNTMLRKRSRGVARTSQHMAGRAIDFFIPDVPLEDQRIAGLKLQHGGVGYYPGSGNHFVHMDTGSVRHWPRMTREQLARVFPTGRTVHIPSDGQPLSGFALAQADVEKRGNSASAPILAAARQAGAISEGEAGRARGILAKLFGLAAEEDEDAPRASAQVASAPAGKTEAAIPMPRTRPGHKAAAATPPATFQVASASSQPATYQVASLPPQPDRAAHATRPDAQASTATSANQAIATRGFWRGLPTTETADGRPRLAELPGEITTPQRDAEPDLTGSVLELPSGRDRVSPIVLAYAAPSTPAPAARPQPQPMGSFLDRISPLLAGVEETAAEGTTVAVKSEILPARRTRTGAVSVPVKPGQRFDEPWLRAVIVTPSARTFMTASLFGTPDFRNLKPMLKKPTASVFMTFSADPHRGLVAERFNGEAVVFLTSVTFESRRTAALR